MNTAVIFDCEFLTARGAMARQWGGPFDPDPSVVQIGAVRLSLDADFDLEEGFQVLVRPRDRYGHPAPIDPFLTELTGIDQSRIDRGGIKLSDALARFERFAGEATLWSWGRDELHLFAISCYVERLTPSMDISRFGNAASLVLKAGMPYEELVRTTSGRLAGRFGIHPDSAREHDALDDARSVALSLQHLLRAGDLAPADFRLPGSTPA